MSATGAGACPACGEPALPGARYCEACGTPLPPAGGVPLPSAGGGAEPALPDRGPTATRSPAADHGRSAPAGAAPAQPGHCTGCGAPPEAIDADGYCTVCGLRQPAPRDHQEIGVDDGLAGVSDRGLRHQRNEDAMALARPGPHRAVVVVCDGVSTTERPDDASQSAADAACAVLVDALDPAAGRPAAPDLATATRDAVAAAQRAVLAVPYGPDGATQLGPPSCTIVTAVLHDGHVTVGWLGDSRAYHLAADGTATPLTVDDSWAAGQVAAGVLSEEEAQADRRAHIITRWLGRDAPDIVPTIVTSPVRSGEQLLVCSDGLWNYAESPEELTALVGDLSADQPAGDLLGLTRSLVAYAHDQGGHDNITVAVCAGGPAPQPVSGDTEQ